LSGQFPNASPAIRANAEQTGKELKCAPAPTPKKAVKKPAPLAKKPAEEPKTEKPEGEE
ncbi:MAG: peptidoglycan-binding protein, partial [Alphaproteobacteria bacterium]|nr:peptidoglycan-binding protein [Alphaproteobacteria bacterium]